MTEKPAHSLRYLVTAAKVALFATLCWFIYQALTSGKDALDEHSWHVEPQWLVLSGICYLLGILPAAIFWHQVLARTGQRSSLGESLRAYYVSQLGKYVPGKWMVLVLRRALLRGSHLENTVVAASVFYETFTLFAVAAAVAAVQLVVWQPHQTLLIATAMGSFLLLGVPIVPSVFERLMRILGVGKLNPTAAERFRHLGARTIIVGWLTIAGGWILMGISFWATLRALGAVESGPLTALSLHTATVALSILAGFLSQIPGGLVVREWVSIQLIEPEYGAAVAAVSVVVFRLVSLISELAMASVLYLSGWHTTRKEIAAVEMELNSP